MVKWAPGGAPGAKTWTSPPESNKKWAPLGAQIKLSARGADFTGPHFTGGHYRGANTNGRWFYGLVFSQFLVRMSFWASWCYGWCEQLALPKTGPEKPIPGHFSCIFLLSHSDFRIKIFKSLHDCTNFGLSWTYTCALDNFWNKA